jgi:hypothetical protein
MPSSVARGFRLHSLRRDKTAGQDGVTRWMTENFLTANTDRYADELIIE